MATLLAIGAGSGVDEATAARSMPGTFRAAYCYDNDAAMCPRALFGGTGHGNAPPSPFVITESVSVSVGILPYSASAPASTTSSDSVVATEAASVEGGLPKLGVEPNFQNPAEAPGSGWEWRGNSDPGTSKGSWYNPESGESLHPDLGHPDPIGPHYDWKAPNGVTYRVYPDGTVVEK